MPRNFERLLSDPPTKTPPPLFCNIRCGLPYLGIVIPDPLKRRQTNLSIYFESSIEPEYRGVPSTEIGLIRVCPSAPLLPTFKWIINLTIRIIMILGQ